MERGLLIVAAFLGLVSVAMAASGTATYYTAPYVPSACYGYTDEGTLIAAASDSLWNSGAICGTYYTVTCTGPSGACTGNSVTVKVVDRCPSPGCQATLDLSEEAFSTIANTAVGKININYN